MHTRRGLLALFGGLAVAAATPALINTAEAQPATAPAMRGADSAPGPAGDLLPRAGNRRNELTRERFGRGGPGRRRRMARRRHRMTRRNHRMMRRHRRMG